MALWIILAAANGLIAVAAGAYGWHALPAETQSLRDIFMIGVHYQMWHALALLAVAWLSARAADAGPGSQRARAAMPATLAGSAFTAGIVLFSGSLYAMGLTGTVPVTGAAPAGGFLLMAGWVRLAAAGIRSR